MVQLILFIIFILLFLIFMAKKLTIKGEPPPIKINDSNSFKINGVNINLSEKEIEEQKQFIKDAFEEKCKELKNRIQKDRDETEDYVRKRVLDKILSKDIFTENDYERIKFMYNDGKLRSNREVYHYDIYQSFSDERKNYAKECKRNNIVLFWIPFLIVFFIFCCILHNVFLLPIALLFGLIAGFIGMMCSYKTNIDNAKTYGISPDNPTLQSEKAKFRSSVIGGTIAAGFMIHNTKKNTKELMDVDSWKNIN